MMDPSQSTYRSNHSWSLSRFLFVSTIGAAILVLGLASVSDADVLKRLEQNADDLEQTFAPAYDYDTDGCYATAAIGIDGTLNPGLPIGGNVAGHCHDRAQLDNCNTYSRGKCNNGWCAIMYASYFEKDQTFNGAAAGSHRHDFEHVVVWIHDNQVEYVSLSHHGGWKWYPRSQVRFDNTHPKVVYHKDGGSTHLFRLANNHDEPPENVTGHWFYPWLVGWGGYPSDALRETLMNANFGHASIEIPDKDNKFKKALASAKPPIPFDPNGP